MIFSHGWYFLNAQFFSTKCRLFRSNCIKLRKLSLLIHSKKLMLAHNKNFVSIIIPTPIISGYDFSMYLHTAHESTLVGKNLHQSQKHHTRFFSSFFFKKRKSTNMQNFYTWCDVGKRKWRLTESLSRVLKYIWCSHMKKTDTIYNVENMNQMWGGGKKLWYYNSKNIEHFCIKSYFHSNT